MLRFTKFVYVLLSFLLIAGFAFAQQPADKIIVVVVTQDLTSDKKFEPNLNNWFSTNLIGTGRYVIVKERKEATYEIKATLNSASFDMIQNVPYSVVSLTILVNEIDPSTGKVQIGIVSKTSIQIQKAGIGLEEAVKEALKQGSDDLKLFQLRFHFRPLTPS